MCDNAENILFSYGNHFNKMLFNALNIIILPTYFTKNEVSQIPSHLLQVIAGSDIYVYYFKECEYNLY